MLAVISPAKSLVLDSPYPPVVTTQPRFLDDAARLAAAAARLDSADLIRLMHISDRLADLNVGRFRAFETPFTEDNARPAIFTFNGDVYTGFDAPSADADTIAYAQDHLRILSGLYGLLRPLDLMQPYRLEMGIKFGIDNKRDLYQFWDGRIADALAADLASHKVPVLINLASQEYAKAIDWDRLPGDVIDIEFKERKDGKLRFSSFAAKRMRGRMARYMCEQQIESPEDLKAFDLDGYAFAPNLSDAHHYLFVKG